ncbi:hypothetical protein J0J26_22750 [Vibrio vulnificus]|uniref:hypothetical protein n=1 Tax=Vibrio vulnificus TaxID=672 RepID=UPI0019D498C6|nr:hypothetical protein [Vibrio vulnificus]MBN8090761.1 hypothetical protein [Vibrio vulnificus]MBN8119733.1 hypothetical protein [Vibrio vulnificus]
MSDFFIPTGDYLRQFIGNSMIKAGDVRDILKKRGIFSSSNDKKVLGPLLVKTGISPGLCCVIRSENKTACN